MKKNLWKSTEEIKHNIFNNKALYFYEHNGSAIK